jgi:phage terminase large subunit
MGLAENTVGVSEIIEAFTPKQREAFESTFTHRYILYGGARGGGKSRWLRWWLLLYLIYQYQVKRLRRVRVGLFCETYGDLRDRQITKIRSEFPPELGEVKETKEDGLCFFLTEANGGGMIALRNLDDPSKYQSAEFAAIGVDELTKTSKDTFDILRGSLRWPGVSHTVFAGATNPGGVGHMWVKQLWIDRQFPPELQNKAPEFVFVRALPADNEHLSQSYWDELNSLPPDLRRAWVEGDWDVFKGQAFTAWRQDRHVIEPQEIPAWWPRLRGIDWGFAAPFCCLWGAKNPDNGRIIIYREAYQAGLTDRQQARLVLSMTPEQENILLTYADPSMWARRRVGETVASTADEYGAVGLKMEPADNDRLNGKRKIDRLLADLQDGQPGLLVFSTCTNLIRTLPALPYDPVQIEDIDTAAEDHAYDALKYLLTGERTARPRPQQGAQQQQQLYPTTRIL